MNREEEITKALAVFKPSIGCEVEVCVAYAKCADDYPSSSLIAKVWNLATKTAIAQVNGEMPYFKSEKEIKEYIKKHIRL